MRNEVSRPGLLICLEPPPPGMVCYYGDENKSCSSFFQKRPRVLFCVDTTGNFLLCKRCIKQRIIIQNHLMVKVSAIVPRVFNQVAYRSPSGTMYGAGGFGRPKQFPHRLGNCLPYGYDVTAFGGLQWHNCYHLSINFIRVEISEAQIGIYCN